MRLKGAEAFAYLQQNPQAGYQVIGGGEPYGVKGGTWVGGQQQGGLAGLLTSMASPFTRAADLLGHANLALAGEGEDYNPQFGYSTPEWQAAKERGLGQEALKSAAGIGSYLIPGGAFGGGLAGTMASAGLAGGLGGLSQVEDIRDPEQLLKGVGLGAATGAAVGGGLYGIGKGLEKVGVGKVGKEVAEEVGEQGKMGKWGVKQQADAISLLDGTLSESENLIRFNKVRSKLEGQGFAVGDTPQEFLENTYQAIKPLGKMRDKGLSEIGKVTSDDMIGVLGSIDEYIQTSGRSGTLGKSGAVDDIYQAVTKLGDNPTATQVDDLARKWRSAVNYETKTKFPARAELYDQAADKAVELLKVKSPTYKSAKEGLSDILGARGEKILHRGARKFSRQGIRSAMISGVEIPVPIKTIQAKLQANVGRLAEKGKLSLPQINMKGLQGVKSGVQKGVQSPLAQYAAPRIGAFGATMPGLPSQAQEEAQTDTSVGGMGGMGGGMSGGMSGGIDQQKLAMMVLSGAIDPKQAEVVMGLMGMGGQEERKLTQQQQKFNAAGQLAGKALQLLEGGEVETGKIAKVKSGIGKFLGTQAPMQTDYFSKLDSARSVAVSALSGANVPPHEFERMAAMIPDPSDEIGVARQKLKSFMEAMQIYSGASGGVSEQPMGMGLTEQPGLY